jgi:lambda repressor-like predicted transcriptional regulator
MDRSPKNSNPRRRGRPVSRGRYVRLDAELDGRGWSLADLARAAGVTYGCLTRATSGYNPPSLNVMDATSRVLGLRPHELWQREPGTGAEDA